MLLGAPKLSLSSQKSLMINVQEIAERVAANCASYAACACICSVNQALNFRAWGRG